MAKSSDTPNCFPCPKCGKELRGGFQTHRKWCDLPAEARFWPKVQKGANDECWLWKGAVQRDGYAHFTHLKRTLTASRFSYELANGPIPAGMDILHSCDNPRCVNPAHLRPGTHFDNMQDKKARGRDPRHKLNGRWVANG